MRLGFFIQQFSSILKSIEIPVGCSVHNSTEYDGYHFSAITSFPINLFYFSINHEMFLDWTSDPGLIPILAFVMWLNKRYSITCDQLSEHRTAWHNAKGLPQIKAKFRTGPLLETRLAACRSLKFWCPTTTLVVEAHAKRTAGNGNHGNSVSSDLNRRVYPSVSHTPLWATLNTLIHDFADPYGLIRQLCYSMLCKQLSTRMQVDGVNNNSVRRIMRKKGCLVSRVAHWQVWPTEGFYPSTFLIFLV